MYIQCEFNSDFLIKFSGRELDNKVFVAMNRGRGIKKMTRPLVSYSI